MNASYSPPKFGSEANVDSFISAVSLGVIGAEPEKAATAFVECVAIVGEAIRNGGGLFKRHAVDRLYNIATAAGLGESKSENWVQDQFAQAFRQEGEARAAAEADVKPLSISAQAAIEYRRERGNGPLRATRTADPDDIAPPDRAPPIGEPVAPARPKFIVEPFDAIRFEASEEWLVKRIVPRQGVVTLYGASQSFKSFLAFDLAMCVALGRQWAGRLVTQTPAIYIAAEGAAGLRKRKVGFERANAERLPDQVPFFLISAAPNLGTEQGDLAALIAAIEAAGVAPGLIVVDTLAQSIGAGDENGAGMIQFVANATALANRFKACVLPVHHVGLSDDKRTRGHSSLLGGVDAQLLAERKEGTLSTVLTLQKLKDDESNLKLTAHLGRFVIGQDEDGDEVSTLIVDRIEEGAPCAGAKPSKSIPRAQRLLMDMVTAAIEEAGAAFRPFGVGGPMVTAAAESAVKTRYYARLAEQAEPGETKRTLIERQGKSFRRSLEAALKATTLIAGEHDGERIVWLP